MDSFHLVVISINRIFYDGPCLQLQVPASNGLLGIMAHHEHAVIGIVSGEMNMQHMDGSWKNAYCGNGYVKIGDNTVYLIVDTVELPEEIDERRAQEAKERAEERLRQNQSLLEYYHTQASLARAMERLKVKRHH
jgi:F-type H+-transporting ATPase subunit epsilon